MNNSLELRIKGVNCLGDLRMKLLQCFYNGKTVVENYLNEHSVIHVHGLLRGRKFCYVCRPSKLTGELMMVSFLCLSGLEISLRVFVHRHPSQGCKCLMASICLFADTSEENSSSPVIDIRRHGAGKS